VVVLSHNPDTKDLLQSYAWDLLACGHTHGGQFYLPFIGTPFAPVQDKRFVKGSTDGTAGGFTSRKAWAICWVLDSTAARK